MTFPPKPGNPPDNPEELAALLSAYLDSALAADEAARIKAWLEKDENVKAAYERLLRLKHLTNRANVVSPLDVDDDSMWQSIAGALKNDAAQVKQHDLAAFDAEFISAYYDGEITRADDECVAFERQLYHCELSNKTLADIGAVSETIRRFGYRLEESCTVDFCEGVMSAYREEHKLSEVAEAEQPEPVIDEESWEKISAHIRRVSAELEKQAPDLWPAVAAELGVEKDNVVPFEKPRKKTAFKIWGPVAAAVFLIVLAVPVMNQRTNEIAGSDMLSQAPVGTGGKGGKLFIQNAPVGSDETLPAGDGSLGRQYIETIVQLGKRKQGSSPVEAIGGHGSDKTLTPLNDAPAELEEAVAEGKAKKEIAKPAAAEPQQAVAAKSTRAKTDELRRERDDAAAPVSVAADEDIPNRYELATLPNRNYSNQPDFVRTGGVAAGGGGNFARPSAGREVMPAAPVVMNKSRNQASYDSAYVPPTASSEMGGAGVRQSTDIPSSEEFLINSLQEQMSNDEIEMIMGL